MSCIPTPLDHLQEGHYRYWHSLLEVEATATGRGPSCFRPATPLRLQAWQKARQSTQTRLSPSIFSMALQRVSILALTELSDCAVTLRTCCQFPNIRSSSTLTSRQYHILAGRGDLFIGNPFPLLQYVLRRIKHSPDHGPRLPRIPITLAILCILIDHWATAATRDTDFVMLWAACCMFFV